MTQEKPTPKPSQQTSQQTSQQSSPQSSPQSAEAAKSTAIARWQDLKEQSILAFESGLLPRSVDTRQKAVTIALMGRELGLSPMQALCGIYVVNGMVALRGSLMLRLIYERVPGARITILTPPEKADQECEVEMQRPGGKPQRFRFTMEDAKRGGMANKPIWHQHPGTMLRWAAIRTGARVVFADAIAGCYMEDELPHDSQDRESAPSAPEAVLAAPTAPAPAPAREPAQEAEFRELAESPGPSEEAAAAAVDSMSEPLPPIPAPEPEPLAPEQPRGGTGPITQKQLNRLFAIAHSKNWTRPEVTALVQKHTGIADVKSLNRIAYEKCCNELLGAPAKNAAGGDGGPISAADVRPQSTAAPTASKLDSAPAWRREPATKIQINMLLAKGKALKCDPDQLLDEAHARYGVEKLENMTKGEVSDFLDYLNELGKERA